MSASKLWMVLGVLLLLQAAPAVAFGAGNIGKLHWPYPGLVPTDRNSVHFQN